MGVDLVGVDLVAPNRLCVCVSATALAGATRTLRAQLRYQKKALDTRIKTT